MVHTEITVDAAVLESYVGRYQFPDDKDIWSIRREGARLFAIHAADPENEIFPETSSDFFFKIADAQVTFVIDKDGRVTGLVLHAAHSKDRHARRIGNPVSRPRHA
jgi:hypothetical protein